MGNTPLYSEGRNVRRLEGSGRKETSLIRGVGGQVLCPRSTARVPTLRNHPRAGSGSTEEG